VLGEQERELLPARLDDHISDTHGDESAFI